MKIELKRSDVITNIDMGDRIDIQIQSSAKIINLLTKNLYSQPWKSCVRELITNAIDANIAAGKADLPIEVEFNRPDRGLLGGCLKISDRGLGMSREIIRTVLATLGVSTKDTDNAQHGGFGIGILSLFSVASQAQLDTCFNGVLYRYLLAIDELGVPCLKLISQEPSESVGTSIIVPIGDERSGHQVADAIGYYCPFIMPQPNYTGADLGGGFLVGIYNRAIGRIDGDGFSYFINLQQPGSEVCVGVRVGQIVYDLGKDYLTTINGVPTVHNWIARNNSQLLIVDIPIGTLDFPTSRENLADTPKNMEVVTEALKQAIAKVRAEIFHVFSTPGSILSAVQLVNRIYFSRNWGISSITWKELEISVDYFFKDLDLLTNVEHGYSTNRLACKLGYESYKIVQLLQSILDNPSRFFIYIGQRQKVRASIRASYPDAFLEEIYILVFESDDDYQEWCENNTCLLALLPDTRIIHKKARAVKATSIESTPAQKLKKWRASPKGLYEINIDRGFVSDWNWENSATPIKTFPKKCIYVSASYLESSKSVSMSEYFDILSLLEIKNIDIVVTTKSVDEKMRLAVNFNDDTFDEFVYFKDYVDREALKYLIKTMSLFADLDYLPLVDSYNHRYVNRYFSNKREQMELLRLALNSNRAVAIIGAEKMRLAKVVCNESMKFGAITSLAYGLKLDLVTNFWTQKEREGKIADPYFKGVFAHLFSDLLDRYPVLRFLPCFCSSKDSTDIDTASFIKFIEDIDKFTINNSI